MLTMCWLTCIRNCPLFYFDCQQGDSIPVTFFISTLLHVYPTAGIGLGREGTCAQSDGVHQWQPQYSFIDAGLHACNITTKNYSGVTNPFEQIF